MMKKFKALTLHLALIAIVGSICFTAGTSFAACPDSLSAYWNLDETAAPDYFDALGVNDSIGNASPPDGRTHGKG